MKKIAVIVAGGSGLRMGTFIPKQFLLLKGKPVLWHTIIAFVTAFDDIKVVLVLPEEHIERGEEIVAQIEKKDCVEIVKGGATRFQSVKNGLKRVEEEAIVFVHDGVRCLVSKNLIVSCYNHAMQNGIAIPAVAATDSIRMVDGNKNFVANRNNVRIIQTPQTFKSNILLPAFAQTFTEAFTDEATVVEAFGNPIFLCEGDYDNIKITRPVDLVIAEKILEER